MFLISRYNIFVYWSNCTTNGTSDYFVWSVLYFTIYFSIRSFSLPALMCSKRTLAFKKCSEGSTTHPIAEWTFEVACQQIVDILQQQMNCDNPQLPQMWIQKYIWNSRYAWQSILQVSLTKWHPLLSLTVLCRNVLSRGCLVVIKRGFLFCFVCLLY